MEDQKRRERLTTFIVYAAVLINVVCALLCLGIASLSALKLLGWL